MSNALSTVKTMAVHDRIFHLDDVTVGAMVRFLNPNVRIIRTSDPEVLKTVDARFDVGGKYDPATLDFDHHRTNPKRNPDILYKGKVMPGPIMSATGLLWENYGTAIVEAILTEAITDLQLVKNDEPIIFNEHMVDTIKESLHRQLIMPIDIEDNGENAKYYGNGNSKYRAFSLSMVIKDMIPLQLEVQGYGLEYMDACYFKAVSFMQDFLVRVMKREWFAASSTTYVFEKLTEQKGDPVIVLEKPCSWFSGMVAASRATPELREAANMALMIIYPVNTTSLTSYKWFVQTLKEYDRGSESMVDKCPFPVELRGKTEEELVAVTRIPGVTFVHHSGFLASADTKEAAITLAKYAITMNGYTV